MQTQNTHGWSTLQEGNAHYLYRPISSMGFTNLEAMIQQLQACQNKQIAVPEIVRIANGDIFLKEPRGIRSLEDFFKTDPTTRAKLFVAQQLVKLLENLHTFVGISHGGLGLHCLSIDADNKLVLGGISPTSHTPSEDITDLQALFTDIFNQPSESDTLKKIQSSSLKKMRRRIKMMLAEDAWDDVQADWSTAIDQTNLEESSEELPFESPSTNADGTLSAMVEMDSMVDPVVDSTRDPIEDVDIFEDELPEPVSFKPSSEQSTQDATAKQSNETDFDWELDDDWEDVDIDGWLDPALDSEALDSEALDSETESALVTNNGNSDNAIHTSVSTETATHDTVQNNENRKDESKNEDRNENRNEDRHEDTLSTITPEMFGDTPLDDWFNEPEDTMPLTQSDLLSSTADAVEEISDFEDDDEVLLFSMKPKEPKSDSSLKDGNVDSFDEKTEIFSSSNLDSALDASLQSNETLDFLLENGEDDLASLTEEAQFQNIDEIDEFTVEEPSEEIPALDDDGDFATDIFSRSSLLGTLDIPADKVQSALEEADMSDSWFVNTPKSTVQSTSVNENPSSVSNTDNGIPKWVWAASAAVVAGGAWAALHQNDTVEPAVLIDEAQTKAADDIDIDSEIESQKVQQTIVEVEVEADQDEQNTDAIQMVASTNSNDDELSVNGEKSVALTTPNETTTKPAPTASNSTKTTRIKSASAKPKPKQTNKVRTTAKKSAPKKVSTTKASPFTSPTETEAAEATTVKTLPTPKKKRPLPVEAPLKEQSSAQPKQTVEREATPKPKQEANVQPIAQTVQEPVPAPIEQVNKVEKVEQTKKVEQTEKVETIVETNNLSERVQQDQESQQDVAPVEDTQPTTTELSAEETTPEPNLEDSETEPDGSWGTLETPSLDTLNPISATDYRNWSTNAVQGKLNDLAIERLQSVDTEDASFTRANAILLTHAQQSGNAELIGNSLEQLLSLNSNTHKPIYLLAMAQHQFNMQNLDGAREYLMQAELNWGNVERSQLMVLRAQRDNIVAHLSYISFLESGSEDSRLQSLTQFRKVQREARRAKLRSLFEQAESKMQQLQRGTV